MFLFSLDFERQMYVGGRGRNKEKSASSISGVTQLVYLVCCDVIRDLAVMWVPAKSKRMSQCA